MIFKKNLKKIYAKTEIEKSLMLIDENGKLNGSPSLSIDGAFVKLGELYPEKLFLIFACYVSFKLMFPSSSKK